MAVRASMVAKAMKEQMEALLAQEANIPDQGQSTHVRSSKGKDFSGCVLGKRARAEDNLGDEWVRRAEMMVENLRGDGSSSSRDADHTGSALRWSSDEETLMMYRKTLRDADQVKLADVPLVKLEDVAAYHSLATHAVIHHLLLRAMHLENELQSCKTKLNEASQRSENRVRTELGRKLKELERSLNDSNLENVKLQKSLEEWNLRFKRLELARDSKRERSFAAGRAAGKEEFIASVEYHAAMKKTREETVEAFMKSDTYAALVAKRAAVFEFKGFNKCRNQAIKLGAFRRNFDTGRLDPFKNENLEEPLIEEEGDKAKEEDEFAYLLQVGL